MTTLYGRKYVDEGEVYAEWIQGYISGFNMINTLSKSIAVDYPGTDLWIRKWCETHPADRLVSAVTSFIRSQIDKQGQE